jgi:hypothetical protein
MDFWLNQFVIVHARFLARCVLNRAAACVDAVNAPCARASIVDITYAIVPCPSRCRARRRSRRRRATPAPPLSRLSAKDPFLLYL